MDAEMVHPRWRVIYSQIELECEELISSCPKVLLVTPGYRENDMSHCVP